MSKELDKNIFTPILEFNNSIFNNLDTRIRPLLTKEKFPTLSRELQIRTLLYTNFNNYLKLLLIKSDKERAIEIINEIHLIPEAERLDLVLSLIHMPLEKVVSNFVKLFESQRK